MLINASLSVHVFPRPTDHVLKENRTGEDALKKIEREDKCLADQRAFELEKLKLQAQNPPASVGNSSQMDSNPMRLDLKTVLPTFIPDKDDISLFLTMFERQMKLLNVPADFLSITLGGVLPSDIDSDKPSFRIPFSKDVPLPVDDSPVEINSSSCPTNSIPSEIPLQSNTVDETETNDLHLREGEGQTLNVEERNDLMKDACSYALGAVLLQGRKPTDEQPVEYASRLLSSAEKNYSTTEREALAVVWALNKFRGYIEGGRNYSGI
ncbi:transposon Ty3-I Gag-Pol polyprotein [Trichonephila clavipes]|nr:transposon Ty3-I Gag-Pol polyprotein [Trichonephila clavipes]